METFSYMVTDFTIPYIKRRASIVGGIFICGFLSLSNLLWAKKPDDCKLCY